MISNALQKGTLIYIYDHIGSKNKQLFKLNFSGHLVTLDIEHDKLFNKIEKFLK